MHSGEGQAALASPTPPTVAAYFVWWNPDRLFNVEAQWEWTTVAPDDSEEEQNGFRTPNLLHVNLLLCCDFISWRFHHVPILHWQSAK